MEAQLSPIAVRAQLQRILAGSIFSHAERSGRLLSFLIDKTLRGEADQVTERLLALDVLERRRDFDPDTDAIVRVETSRLRYRLREYYEAEGRDDPVLIELPPRTYIPVFRQRVLAATDSVEQPSSRRPARRWRLAVGSVALLLLAGAVAWRVLSSRMDWFQAGRPETRERSTSSAVPLSSAPSIVVLPFTDLSAAKDQDYFCDGLTEEILETLTKVEGLRVVSRTSAFRFKGRIDDVRRIGAELNVRMALEGSVRKDGNRLRVDVRLVNAADGYHIWSRTFDRELQDVFAIQRDIARGIVGTLRNQLAQEYWLRPLEERTPSLQAYNQYLHGLQSAHQGSIEKTRQAIDYFERAVKIDGKYASAYAELAQCYAVLAVYAAAPPGKVMPKARAAAEKALALDSTVPDAHAALGLAKAIGEWDWAGAAFEFRHALELDPTDSSVLEDYVLGYLLPSRRLDDALRVIREAQTFDPASARTASVAGLVHYFRREDDQAIAMAQQALETSPNFHTAYIVLGSAYEHKAMFAEAVAAFQKGAATWPSGLARALLGHTYAVMARRAEAQALVQELIRLSGERYVSPLDIAVVYTGLGDDDHAFEWLEKAYEQRAANLIFLTVNPRFDRLRRDPRFTELVKRVHLQ